MQAVGSPGLGSPEAMWVLNRFILWQTVMTCGEIAAKRPERSSKGASPRALAAHKVVPGKDRSNWGPRASPASANGVAAADPSLVNAWRVGVGACDSAG